MMRSHGSCTDTDTDTDTDRGHEEVTNLPLRKGAERVNCLPHGVRVPARGDPRPCPWAVGLGNFEKNADSMHVSARQSINNT